MAVVIPAFNEQHAIERTLCGLPQWVDLAVVVDDASTDATVQVVEAFAMRCRSQGIDLTPEVFGGPVEMVVHSVNCGVGKAIVSGYRRALGLGADCLVVMAGDDQMSPADLPRLVSPVVKGQAKYAKGNRFLHASWRSMPRHRRWGGRVLSALTAWTTSLKIGDSQCGFTALCAATAQSLPLDDLWSRYGYPNDLLGMLSQAGATLVEVPVAAVYADEKSGIRWYHLAVVTYVIVRRAWLNRGKPHPSISTPQIRSCPNQLPGRTRRLQ